jgi:hypothetical protein
MAVDRPLFRLMTRLLTRLLQGGQLLVVGVDGEDGEEPCPPGGAGVLANTVTRTQLLGSAFAGPKVIQIIPN